MSEAGPKSEVREKLDRLKRDRAAGADLTVTHGLTVGEWTKTWIEIVERTRRPSTAKTYRTHLKYLEPLLWRHLVDGPADGVRRSVLRHLPWALSTRASMRRAWVLTPREVWDRPAGGDVRRWRLRLRH